MTLYNLPRLSDEYWTKLKSAFAFAERQVEKLITEYPDFFPLYTKEGKWMHEGEPWTNWCEGFLVGLMWLFYHHTGKTSWWNRAIHYAKLIEVRKHDRSVHDLGFLFWPSWKPWFDITGDDELDKVIITAGKTMGQRFIEPGGYFPSFLANNSVFIDIMMNVGIVFYAAKKSHDEDLCLEATRHCMTTRRFLVRGDGSTAQEGIFDLDTGEFLHHSTQQGFRSNSTWARGQTWGLYGFGTAYQFTGDNRFLDTACRCADFFLERTDFDSNASRGSGIPYNDLNESGGLVDSSAAAIAASGLLSLSDIVQDQSRAISYRRSAIEILDTLTSIEYLAKGIDSWEGILLHGIYHTKKGLGVDESVMWGDFFFVEALNKAMRLNSRGVQWKEESQ